MQNSLHILLMKYCLWQYTLQMSQSCFNEHHKSVLQLHVKFTGHVSMTYTLTQNSVQTDSNLKSIFSKLGILITYYVTPWAMLGQSRNSLPFMEPKGSLLPLVPILSQLNPVHILQPNTWDSFKCRICTCISHTFWQEFTLQNWGAAYARN
jgi:hypothetical protein